jgi:hypothetical protein
LPTYIIRQRAISKVHLLKFVKKVPAANDGEPKYSVCLIGDHIQIRTVMVKPRTVPIRGQGIAEKKAGLTPGDSPVF